MRLVLFLLQHKSLLKMLERFKFSKSLLAWRSTLSCCWFYFSLTSWIRLGSSHWTQTWITAASCQLKYCLSLLQRQDVATLMDCRGYLFSRLNGIATDSPLGFPRGGHWLSLGPCRLVETWDTSVIDVCFFASSDRFCHLFLATLCAWLLLVNSLHLMAQYLVILQVHVAFCCPVVHFHSIFGEDRTVLLNDCLLSDYSVIERSWALCLLKLRHVAIRQTPVRTWMT